MVHIAGKRYLALMDDKARLTKKEMEDGWHFCYEWDGLLIHPSHTEANCCSCIPKRLLNKYAKVRKEGYNDSWL